MSANWATTNSITLEGYVFVSRSQSDKFAFDSDFWTCKNNKRGTGVDVACDLNLEHIPFKLYKL